MGVTAADDATIAPATGIRHACLHNNAATKGPTGAILLHPRYCGAE
jgi:hypothetical protein